MPPSKANDRLPAMIEEAACRVMQRCDELATCSERPGEITRTFCSPAMQAAHERLRTWMTAAGLECRLDAAANLIGRQKNRTGRTLLNGSHLDSVINAGRYDGVLGVLMGLALAEILEQTQTQLPFALEVIAFCEEEGVRFRTPYIGSRAAAGLWPDDLLQRRDAQGHMLADVLRTFGGNPEQIADAAYDPNQVIAYIEPHIEQGPVLEAEGLPVGIVTGITGQTRAGLTFRGQAGHAGTVPMHARRDALAAAAQWITDVEELARYQSGLVATIGCVQVRPGAINVIPDEVSLTLDVRHLEDTVRTWAADNILQRAEQVSRSRGINYALDWVQHEPAVKCDEPCIRLLEQAVADVGLRCFRLPSGAGHDAAIMGKRFPAAMLFVRCAGGVSHHPDEAVAKADVAIALEVLWRLVYKLADEEK